MIVRRRWVAASLVLVALVVTPASVAVGVEEVERELEVAARSLEEIEAALAAAEREIVAAERRLRDAAADLQAVEDELAAAERAVARAEAVRRDRTRDLEDATTALAAAEEAEAAAIARLSERSVEVFKYGAGREQQALVTSLIGASDWHEVAVSASTVARIVESDRHLVETAIDAREAAEVARLAATDARVAAVAAEQQAIAEGAHLRAVVDEHEQALAAVQAEHAHRAAVVAALQADSHVAAMLVSKLEQELAQARAAVAEPEPQPDEDAPPGPSAPPAWASRLPPAGQPWAEDIAAAAAANGIGGRLFAALVWTESSFNPSAVSWVGAIGLAQLMPGTAAELGVDPWDPHQNLDGGARYLARQYQRFGSLELALAAYNAGPTAVANSGPGIPNYVETQLYVVRVLERYNLLHAA